MLNIFTEIPELHLNGSWNDWIVVYREAHRITEVYSVIIGRRLCGAVDIIYSTSDFLQSIDDTMRIVDCEFFLGHANLAFFGAVCTSIYLDHSDVEVHVFVFIIPFK